MIFWLLPACAAGRSPPRRPASGAQGASADSCLQQGQAAIIIDTYCAANMDAKGAQQLSFLWWLLAVLPR